MGAHKRGVRAVCPPGREILTHTMVHGHQAPGGKGDGFNMQDGLHSPWQGSHRRTREPKLTRVGYGLHTPTPPGPPASTHCPSSTKVLSGLNWWSQLGVRR